MIFTSKHAGLIYGPIIPEKLNYNVPQGVMPQIIRPAIFADFGAGYGNELMSGEFHDDDGSAHADIRGGVFDTEEAATRMGWLPEEKEFVEATMLGLANDPRFNDFALWSKPVPVAPIAGWEKLGSARKLAIAAELGIVSEALAYERAVGGDDEAVEMLAKKHGTLEAEQALTAA